MFSTVVISSTHLRAQLLSLAWDRCPSYARESSEEKSTSNEALKIADFRSLCFMLVTSMFHACGLYVSCLRPLSTTHGYDKGRIAFWGARKRLGALAVLCGFERRAWNTGAVRRAWNIGAGFVLFGSCFSVVLFVVRSSVRAFGRSFRGSFFCSCFWSFFSWFVLLVVLWVRASGRSFCGSFFWFVLLGARMCFLFDALKVLEACVARSEVS